MKKRDEVHLSVRYFLIVLADRCSGYSVGGGLGLLAYVTIRPGVVAKAGGGSNEGNRVTCRMYEARK